MEFRYTNRGPLPWAVMRTNVIRLSREGEAIIFSRHYVSSKDGTFDEEGISQTLPSDTGPWQLARGIHWGCCGWDASPHQIPSLFDKVGEFFEMEESNEVK